VYSCIEEGNVLQRVLRAPEVTTNFAVKWLSFLLRIYEFPVSVGFNIEMYLRDVDYLSGSKQSPWAGFREHDNENSECHKSQEFFDS
jgi:hypothetical protein